MDMAAPFPKAPIEQPAEQEGASEMLVIGGASGVAVPLSREWGPDELRQLTSSKTVERLSKALHEPVPDD